MFLAPEGTRMHVCITHTHTPHTNKKSLRSKELKRLQRGLRGLRECRDKELVPLMRLPGLVAQVCDLSYSRSLRTAWTS